MIYIFNDIHKLQLFFSCLPNPNGGVAKLSLKLRIDDHAPIAFMN